MVGEKIKNSSKTRNTSLILNSSTTMTVLLFSSSLLLLSLLLLLILVSDSKILSVVATVAPEALIDRGDKPNILHVATQVNILDTPINIVFFFTFILDDSFHELFAK